MARLVQVQLALRGVHAMVTPSMTTQYETNRYESHRTPSLLLPENPSQDELAQYWTLSARDQAEVMRCRTDATRRRFAVQLCTLRAYGRFLPEATPTPVAITNYLARQLDIPLILFGEVPGRFATETEHLQRIRTYLGWRPFDDESRLRLTSWINQRATDDLLPSVLVTRAEDILRAWQIVAPARSTLEELVASVTAHVQDDVYTRITIGLRPEILQAMDALLQVPPGARRSMLFQLKEYPAEASYAVILRYIEHYHFLRELGVGTIDLGGISLPMIRYCADQAKRYDVHTLRRFPETKRYGLTACFLVEIHKTILDHIVALHDQLLTKKMREARNAFEKRYRQVRRQSRRGFAKLITTGETLLDPERPLRQRSRLCCTNSMRRPSVKRSRRVRNVSIWRTVGRLMPCGRGTPACGGISPRSSPYPSTVSQEATPSRRDSTSSDSSIPGPSRRCLRIPRRLLSQAGFGPRCTTRTQPWIVAPGNWGWPWPSAMASAPATSTSRRVDVMCPLRT
jgi:Domain of unknown function (DUF4158)